jgi:hypothetical protein
VDRGVEEDNVDAGGLCSEDARRQQHLTKERKQSKANRLEAPNEANSTELAFLYVGPLIGTCGSTRIVRHPGSLVPLEDYKIRLI